MSKRDGSRETNARVATGRAHRSPPHPPLLPAPSPVLGRHLALEHGGQRVGFEDCGWRWEGVGEVDGRSHQKQQRCARAGGARAADARVGASAHAIEPRQLSKREARAGGARRQQKSAMPSRLRPRKLRHTWQTHTRPLSPVNVVDASMLGLTPPNWRVGRGKGGWWKGPPTHSFFFAPTSTPTTHTHLAKLAARDREGGFRVEGGRLSVHGVCARFCVRGRARKERGESDETNVFCRSVSHTLFLTDTLRPASASASGSAPLSSAAPETSSVCLLRPFSAGGSQQRPVFSGERARGSSCPVFFPAPSSPCPASSRRRLPAPASREKVIHPPPWRGGRGGGVASGGAGGRNARRERWGFVGVPAMGTRPAVRPPATPTRGERVRVIA